MQKISPFLWFNDQAEEAANFTSPSSRTPCGWLKDKYGLSWQTIRPS